MGSPNLVANHLILKDGRRIQQTQRAVAPLFKANKKRQARPPAAPIPKVEPSYLPRLTAFFRSAPAVNLATRRAAILMVAPVCGLRPLRAFRDETENVPKPISATRSPFFNAAVMLSTAVSIAVPAWDLLMPAPPAILSIKSALFISSPGGSSS